MKIISPKLHGILDYILIIFLYLSPVMFSMATDTATYTYILATVHLLLTIVTNYSYGIFKIVPLKIHGIIELLVGVGLTVAAFTLLQYDERAKGYYAGLGIMILIIAIFSDYNSERDTVKAPIL